MGEEEKEFEEKLAEYVGVKHVVGCSDGTAGYSVPKVHSFRSDRAAISGDLEQ